MQCLTHYCSQPDNFGKLFQGKYLKKYLTECWLKLFFKYIVKSFCTFNLWSKVAQIQRALSREALKHEWVK